MNPPQAIWNKKWIIVAALSAGAVATAAGRLRAEQKPAPAPAANIEIGPGKSLQAKAIFPPTDAWNQDISSAEVDPNSDRLIASIGLKKPLHPDFGTVYNGAPMGIPYVVVGKDQPRVPIEAQYKDESDPGPYPIPADAPIEGGPSSTGDRHVLVVDRDNWMLYELWSSYPQDGGKSWKVGSAAIFDMKKGSYGQRPKGWTSSDAAGLPVLAGLVRYDEVAEQKEIRHAIRFTIVKSRHGYVAPATHYASNKNDPNLPPMGMRVRLKASFDISKFSPKNQVILTALKKYGMIVADNGSDWFISGAPDPRWDNDELHALTKVKGADFEVVKMGPVTTR